jgi:glyoxylase-like metal-dependent hydrolase (beta-lactamase superfamily II)
MELSMPAFRAAIAALALSFVAAAHAAAPMARTPPPGFFRMMLGDFEITALSDGTIDLPVDKFMYVTKEAADKALGKVFLASPLETSVNAYLVNTGEKLVLIDTGTGNLFGPTLGKLVANLKASGYQPEQVDEIYITHMHGDHVGGLAQDGKMSFPNAVVRADKRDADYWLSSAALANADKDSKALVEGAQAALAPYVKADRLHPFDGDTQLIAGVRAQAAYGHTPGHTVYIVESKGQKLALWGDLLHVAALQFADPSIGMKGDSDTKAATAARERAFADAAKNGYWVGAAHLPFPGLGHVVTAGKGYAFVPANYTEIRAAAQ